MCAAAAPGGFTFGTGAEVAVPDRNPPPSRGPGSGRAMGVPTWVAMIFCGLARVDIPEPVTLLAHDHRIRRAIHASGHYQPLAGRQHAAGGHDAAVGAVPFARLL